MKTMVNGWGKRVGAAVGILTGLLLLVQKASADTQFTNEFWVCDQTNTANLGTLSDPYDGSTQSKFDSVMANLPRGCTVHLLAGTYLTHGNQAYLLKSQKVLGSGTDVTIVKLAADTPSYTAVFGSLPQSGVEISDLTCDAGLTGTNIFTGGVLINGTQTQIRRVKVINLSSPSSDLEVFGIQVFSDSTNNLSVGNIIEDCEVSHFRGLPPIYMTAIGLAGTASAPISGIVRNNTVILSGPPAIASIGINGGSLLDCLIEGNYVYGAFTGVYGDTGGSTNFVVAHNVLRDVVTGVYLRANNRKNLTFTYNTIALATNVCPSGCNSYAFIFTDELSTTYTNVSIIGNTLTYNGVPAAIGFGLVCQSITGLLAANNRVHPSMANVFDNCSSLNVFNNFDLNGNLITNMNQIAAANGITRGTVSATNYNVSYTDRYLGIKTTSAASVNLPLAASRPGKEIIVAKEVSDVNTVTINASSPETINGASSISFSTRYGIRSVISDGTNWLAR